MALIFLALALVIGGLWWQRERIPFLERLLAADPSILYLAEDEQSVVQIYAAAAANTAVRQLTNRSTSVLEFSPAPNGRRVAFLVADGNPIVGDEAIWIVDKNGRGERELLRCDNAICSNLTWAPDSRLLMYERREVGSNVESGTAGPPRLWWLDANTQETVSVLQDEKMHGTNARISPDGEWLAFALADSSLMQLYNFATGENYQIASETGDPVTWHPDSVRFIQSDLGLVAWQADPDQHRDDEHVHYGTGNFLYLVDVATAARTQLSADTVIDDGSPAWSPDGDWVAFGRRPARTALGRQIWLLSVADNSTRALTDDAMIHHGALSWSPDGRYLLYQRFDMTSPDAEPGVWVLEVETGVHTKIADAGFVPLWLPASASSSE